MNVMRLIFVLLVWGLSACSDTAKPRTAGIEGTGDRVASGSITGFGSVYVNGVHFSTAQAKVDINGEWVDENVLEIGMIVDIEGALDNAGEGRAEKILYKPTITGKVTRISLVSADLKTLEISGQWVDVTPDTTLKDVGFDQLAVDQFLEVSGFVADGRVRASHIRLNKKTSATVTIAGEILAVDLTAKQLKIGQQWINFSNAQWMDTSVNAIAVNDRIIVKGTLNADGTLLLAESIQKTLPFKPKDHKPLSLEGIVQQTDSTTKTFKLQNITVHFGAAKFNRGELVDLSNGLRVSVRGQYESNNTLSATEITLMPTSRKKMGGPVEFIDFKNGTLSVMGVDYALDALTGYGDRSKEAARRFGLQDIKVGDYLEIYGSERGDGFNATRIERVNYSDKISLKGEISSVLNDTEIVVMGVQVDLSKLNKDIDMHTLMPGIFVMIEGFAVDAKRIQATQVMVFNAPDCHAQNPFECNDFDNNGFPRKRGFNGLQSR